MGMYDDVRYRAQCPWCKAELTEFQTKEADCNLEMLDPATITYWYALCDCGCFLEVGTGLTKSQHEERKAAQHNKSRRNEDVAEVQRHPEPLPGDSEVPR